MLAVLLAAAVIATPIPPDPVPVPKVTVALSEPGAFYFARWLPIEMESADLPPDYDAIRFIDKASAAQQYKAAVDHLAWLRWQMVFDRNMPAWKIWSAWEPDAMARVDLWSLVTLLKDNYEPNGTQASRIRTRQRLGELREWLGDEAYYAASLPSPVPIWRYW